MIEKTEKSLYSEIRKAVHNEWDPIGVSNFTNDLGEYDAYIPELCRFLSHNPSSQEIFDYLWVIETNSIGMEGDKQSTLKFSEKLKILIDQTLKK